MSRTIKARPHSIRILGILSSAAILAGCMAGHMERPTIMSAPPANYAPAATVSELVPPESLPGRDEELWIIEPPNPPPAVASDRVPGSIGIPLGSGLYVTASDQSLRRLPLGKTAIDADIMGGIASVDVHQQFANPLTERADLTYEFLLPRDGTVSEFVMSIGRRHIRGIVRERAEAEQIFRESRGMGLLATLVVQQASGIFLQRVANMEPGKPIDVEIRYLHTVPCRAGSFEFTLPTAVAPREAAAMDAERNGRDLSVDIHLNPGFPIEMIESTTHLLSIRPREKSSADVSLIPADHIANRDLVLRYKPAGEAIQTSLMIEPGENGGTAALLMVAPSAAASAPRRAMDVILEMDPGSGVAGNDVAGEVLRNLSPDDTFQIVRAVPGSAAPLLPNHLPATAPNVDRYASALATMSSIGAPQSDVLRAALAEPVDAARLRLVLMVTDGNISLRDTLPIVREGIGEARLVVLAVASTPDRGAVETLARAGRGPAVYLPYRDSTRQIVPALLQSLSHPAIEEIQVDWNGIQMADAYPHRLADLYAGRAVLVMGRYYGPAPKSIAVIGRVGGALKTWTVMPATAPALSGKAPLAGIWARRKMADLLEAATYRPSHTLMSDVRQIALDYGLLSRFTSFVCVDALSQPNDAAFGPSKP